MTDHNDFTPADYRTYSGRRIYCRSLCFLLSKACSDLFPGSKLKIRRPISKGYHCLLEKDGGLTSTDVDNIASRMRSLVEQDLPFVRHETGREEAMAVFEGQKDKQGIIGTSSGLRFTYYTLGDTPDFYYDALLPSTGALSVWSLSLYNGGMLMRVPDRHDPTKLAPFREQPKTFEVFSEYQRWNSVMGLENVGDLNCACRSGRAAELIQISEALQEKKIVSIAEEIDRRYRAGGAKVVLITGPTSSGKSTFCKRLSIQLMACGIKPVSLSTDDYFVNRVDSPKLPDGSYDFDNFETVDHDYMQRDIQRLLNGGTVSVPTYNFVTGLREYNDRELTLREGSVLLIEGIHALNPMLTESVPAKEKYRIFINTITSLSLDDHNCIPTSDIRLIRRIVRDYNMGSYTAQATISNWPMVRRNEVKWIYPFQEEADVLFNSSYLVEFAVLRSQAERILLTVPKDCPEYGEALRLSRFLAYFFPVSDKQVPPTSLIRSFIGGGN